MDYKNTKIYKIWSTQGDKIYVGATTKQYLSQRMTAHRRNYNCWKNTKLKHISSYILFEEYDINNCFIELLEAKECKDRHEQAQIEGKYIRELECVNKIISGRCQKEYYQDNKEILLAKQKQYDINNKEAISSRRKGNYKLSQQEYHKANNDAIKTQQKKYRDENKEMLSARRKAKYKLKKEALSTNEIVS